MRAIMITGVLVAALAGGTTAPAFAKGCIKGAIVGGIAGHALHHGVMGAVGGCAVGHHLAHRKHNTEPANASATGTEAPAGAAADSGATMTH